MIPNAEFLTPLRLEDIDGAEGILLEPLKFYSRALKGTVQAPAGMQTDFASIPRGLWNLLPKRGKHDKAAVIHDAAYRGLLQTSTGRPMKLIKPLADDLFNEAMTASGVNRISRFLMFRAVCWFGGAAYHGLRTANR